MNEFISRSFDETLRHFKISGKAIAQASETSQSQISEFRRGKHGLSIPQLERVLVAMETLAPGSRLHFCLLVAGDIQGPQMATLLNSVADRISTREPAGTAA